MLIIPNWPAPDNIKAYSTTREGGFSQPPYDSFNLATHVEDDIDLVTANRDRLKTMLQLPNEPVWLTQQHGNIVIDADSPSTLDADGAYTNKANTICVISTADCLPILLCNKEGTEIAALHGGWRSLSQDIIEIGIKKFRSHPQDILAWSGPSIGPDFFEVGEEVRDIFIKKFPDIDLEITFKHTHDDRFLFDLPQFTKKRLLQLGITNVFSSNFCTYSDSKRFYSYRRNGKTGRMATLIWKSR